jgi:hypothetical protein
VIGYWSKTFIGWVAYHESIPLIPHDVTAWEPIADQAAARAIPLVKVRQAGATTVVVGSSRVVASVMAIPCEAKAPRRSAAPTGRRARKPVVVIGVDWRGTCGRHDTPAGEFDDPLPCNSACDLL